MGSYDATWHVEEDGTMCGYDAAGRVLEQPPVRVKSGPPLDLTPEKDTAERAKLVQAMNVVDGLGLTELQRKVYMVIQRHRILYPGTNWPAMSRVALEVGCSRQYADDVVEGLITSGLLPARRAGETLARDRGSACLNFLLFVALFALVPALVAPLHVGVTRTAMVLTTLAGLVVIRRWQVRERIRSLRARAALAA